MASKDNLIPGAHKLTLDEQSAGGRASGISRRKRKHGQELVRMMLQMDVSDAQVLEAMRKLGYEPDEVDNELAMHARQIEKAQKTGDTKAYAAVMKVAGYDTTNVNVTTPKPLVISEEEAAKLDTWAKDE